ncbi:hypothetical protein BC937DRAFT_89764 [Endogone sp. FLAS-F59071]|nr:hypothetical protein BC937DRAFT_89764 [Endogone sp. FLAS-F59071]|eukprot:RUS17592.1 hypothetical protein BC937DRAFT_89764 [Endogone sp. FLAS-F59071]
MVQDTGLGQEYFVSAFETTDEVTGAKKWSCYQYTDDPVPGQRDEIDVNAVGADLFGEKQLLYCVSVPGETTWAARIHAGADNGNIQIEDGSDQPSAQVTSLSAAAKYPFPEEKHVAVVVKVYGRDESIKVADVVEFIGVLGSVRPTPQESELDNFDVPSARFGEMPIVHAITHRKLTASFLSGGAAKHARDPCATARLHRISSRRGSVGGRVCAAAAALTDVGLFVLFTVIKAFVMSHTRYLLINGYLLFSTSPQLLSHTRNGSLTLGHLALTITHFPPPPSTTTISSSTQPLHVHSNPSSRPLASVLASLLPKYHDLPLTLGVLNGACFFPRSEDEILSAGVLQVAEGTAFVVDETVLEEGGLGDQGVRNMQALSNLLTNQTLAYAFPFSSFEFPTDINVIVLSVGGKSLLPSHCAVPLQSTESISEHGMENVLPAETLSLFRGFVQCLKYRPYEISKEMSEHIQEAFVEQRRLSVTSGAPLPSQEDLMLRMSLARLVAQSFGQTQLTVEAWRHAVALDEERRRRAASGNFAGTVGGGVDGRVGK